MRKELMTISRYIDFLMGTALLVDDDIDLNSKSFNWPKQISKRVEIALERVSRKKDEAEAELYSRREAFKINLNEREAQLDTIARKDPPVLTTKEMRECHTLVTTFMDKLEQDTAEAKNINEEENLLELEESDYDQLLDMTECAKNYSLLWDSILEFHLRYEKWFNGPFTELNAVDIEETVGKIWLDLYKLTKIPDIGAGSKRAAEIVLIKVEKFRQYLPILRVICNSSLRETHWKMISEMVGSESILNEEYCSLSQLLSAAHLENYVAELEKISFAATGEFHLQQTLLAMKEEWTDVKLPHTNYRESDLRILFDVDDIHSMLEDHLTRIQAIRTSPFVAAVEESLHRWEETLITMQDTLDEWIRVQTSWTYLEPIFCAEDILRQMPDEVKCFEKVSQLLKELSVELENDERILRITRRVDLNPKLIDAGKILHAVKSKLNAYLDKKRALFPRFFFLSNKEVLEILSEGDDLTDLRAHLECFQGIDSVRIDDNFDIVEIISEHGETVHLSTPVSPLEYPGCVEKWLDQLEDSMIQTLMDLMNKAVDNRSVTHLADWILQYPAMIAQTAYLVHWTKQVERSIVKRNLLDCAKQCEIDIEGIRNVLLNSNLEKKDRDYTLPTLIVTVSYARHVVRELIENDVRECSDPIWLNFTRFYQHEQRTFVNIASTRIPFGYEYLGNTTRLILGAPETKSAYASMAKALHSTLCPALFGKSGSGKTETCRDFARTCGKAFFSFNCTSDLGYDTICTLFKGATQSGAWLCLEEVDTVNGGVLSTVAQDIDRIQNALRLKINHVILGKATLPLNHTCAVFVTTKATWDSLELPLNFRELLYPVEIVQPERSFIVPEILQSYGFNHRIELNEKIRRWEWQYARIFSEKRCAFDLEDLKKGLTLARNSKVPNTLENESQTIASSLLQLCKPAFSNKEIDDSFRNMLQEAFSISLSSDDKFAEIRNKVRGVMKNLNLDWTDDHFTDAVVNLYEALLIHRAVVLVGEPCSGKSTAYRIISEMLSQDGNCRTNISVINPDSMTTRHLYGYLIPTTNEWIDGVFSKILREQSDSITADKKWLVLDGAMNPAWLQPLTTVLDSSNKMCLSSGEVIQMNERMRIIFETRSVETSPKSALLHCGIVYFENDLVSLDSLLVSWRSQFKLLGVSADTVINAAMSLIQWIFPATVEFVVEFCQCNSRLHQKSLYLNIMRLCGSLIECEFDSAKVDALSLQNMVLFCVYWNFHFILNDNFFECFDEFFRSLVNGKCESHPRPSHFQPTKYQIFPEQGFIFDYKYNRDGWQRWKTENASLKKTDIQNGCVKTIDLERTIWFLNVFVRSSKSVVVIGQVDSGKSSAIGYFFSALSEAKFVTIVIPLSANTRSDHIRNTILSNLERKRKGVFGPPMGKKLVVIFKNVEILEETNSAIQLITQLVSENFCYSANDFSKIDIVDTTYILTMRPTNNSSIDRLLTKLNFIVCRIIDHDSAKNIFTAILDTHLSAGFPEQICRLSKAIVKSTLQIISEMRDANCCLGQFGLRDVGKVITGLRRMSPQKCQAVDEFLRLWVYNLSLIFSDNLEAQSQRDILFETLNATSYELLRQPVDQYLGHLKSNTTEKLTAEHITKLCFTSVVDEYKDYDEIPDSRVFVNFAKKLISNRAFPTDSMTEYFVENISKVVDLMERGNVIIVGNDGFGRKIIVKLAAQILNYEIVQISVDSVYLEEWKNILKAVIVKCCLECRHYVLSLVAATNEQSKTSNEVVEDAHTLIGGYNFWYLFDQEERLDIVNRMIEAAPDKNMDGKIESPGILYWIFANRAKRYLRVIVITNPDAKNLWISYPALRDANSHLKRFHQWKKDALESLADQAFKVEPVFKSSEQFLRNATIASAAIYLDVANVISRLKDESISKDYLTPEVFRKFLETFRKLYSENVSEINAEKNRYECGVNMLNSASNQVLNMRNELQILRPKLIANSEDTEKLMVKIEQNTVEIEATKEIVAADEALANEAAAASQAIRDDCESDLAEAEPALLAATEALNTLNATDINVVKAMKNPPPIVKFVMEAVCVMKGLKAQRRTNTYGRSILDYWPESLKVLSDPKLLESLSAYEKDNIDPEIMKLIRERFLPHSNFNVDNVRKVSRACEGLCRWVRAIEIYDRVIKIVAPKKVRLAEAEQHYATRMRTLNHKRALLAEVMEKLQTLRDELTEKTREKKELEDSIQMTTLKLKRADILIATLGDEKIRWTDKSAALRNKLERSLGNSLLASAIIVYLAGISPNRRDTHSIVAKWSSICKSCHVDAESDPRNVILSFYPQDLLLRRRSLGLPEDYHSVENSFIADKCPYISILIDPQEEGKNWLLAEKCAKVINTSVCPIDDQVMNAAIENDGSILFENFIDAGELEISDFVAKLEYYNSRRPKNEDLANVYISTRNMFAQFSPLIANKVSIVNYTQSVESFKHHFTNAILGMISPEICSTKREQTARVVTDNVQLKRTEQIVLDVLSSSNRNILDDPAILKTLVAAKKSLDEIHNSRKVNAVTRGTDFENGDLPLASDLREIVTDLYMELREFAKIDKTYFYHPDIFVDILRACLEDRKMEDVKSEMESIGELYLSKICEYIRYSVSQIHRNTLMSRVSVLLKKRRRDVEIGSYSPAPSNVLSNTCADWHTLLPIIVWFVETKNINADFILGNVAKTLGIIEDRIFTYLLVKNTDLQELEVMVKKRVESEQWLILVNTFSEQTWPNNLQRIICEATLANEKIPKNFRLWIVSKWFTQFPLELMALSKRVFI